jgi:hypothetical protein
VVLQLETVHLAVLRSLGRQLVGKARVVVAPRKQQLAVVPSCLGRLLDLAEVGLHRLQLFNNAWSLGPAQRVVPADSSPVECIAIADNGVRLQFLDSPQQATVRGGVLARPEVSVTENDYGLVEYA